MPTEIIKGGFRTRDLPLNADYRPMYKIGLIVLILDKVCRAGKSSLNKLHFFIWALKSQKNMAFIRMAFINNDLSKIVSWGVEPALNKALNYAVGEGLIQLHDDKYVLTEIGLALEKKIKMDKDLFVREKNFLNYIGKQKVTEEFINKLTDGLNK
ncbi:hypothetical protein [Niabella aquatica]